MRKQKEKGVFFFQVGNFNMSAHDWTNSSRISSGRSLVSISLSVTRDTHTFFFYGDIFHFLFASLLQAQKTIDFGNNFSIPFAPHFQFSQLGSVSTTRVFLFWVLSISPIIRTQTIFFYRQKYVVSPVWIEQGKRKKREREREIERLIALVPGISKGDYNVNLPAPPYTHPA